MLNKSLLGPILIFVFALTATACVAPAAPPVAQKPMAPPPTATQTAPTETQAPLAETQAPPTAVAGKELSSLTAHTNEAWALDISPDGARLATGSVDGTAKIWDLSNNEELLVLNGKAGIADDVAFSPDGAHLVVSYSEGKTKLWDTKTGQELLTLPGTSWATKY